MPTPPLSEQRSRIETHNGIEISVFAYQQPSGGWSWAYVAYGLIGQSKGALLHTAKAALTRGMLAAQARIDLGLK